MHRFLQSRLNLEGNSREARSFFLGLLSRVAAPKFVTWGPADTWGRNAACADPGWVPATTLDNKFPWAKGHLPE